MKTMQKDKAAVQRGEIGENPASRLVQTLNRNVYFKPLDSNLQKEVYSGARGGRLPNSFNSISNLQDRFYDTKELPAVNPKNVESTFRKLASYYGAIEELGGRLHYLSGLLVMSGQFRKIAKNPSSGQDIFHDYLYQWALLQNMAAKMPKNLLGLLSDEQLIKFAKSVKDSWGMAKRSELKLTNRALYGELIGRGKAQNKDFFKLAGFDNQNESPWANTGDKEFMKGVFRFIEKRGITSMTELQDAKADVSGETTPYWELHRRDKADEKAWRIDKITEYLGPKRRPLARMTNKELIAEGQAIIKKNKIESIQQFAKADQYLVGKLVERLSISKVMNEFGLIDECPRPKAPAPVQEARAAMLPPRNAGPAAPTEAPSGGPAEPAISEFAGRQYMNWKGMSDEEVVGFIKTVMKVNPDLRSLNALRKSPDYGSCYEILRDRGLRFHFKTQEDERIDDYLQMKEEELLALVRRRHIGSEFELRRYRSLVDALYEKKILHVVLGWFRPDGSLASNGSNGKKEKEKKDNGNGSNGKSNVIELYPESKSSKGKGKKAA